VLLAVPVDQALVLLINLVGQLAVRQLLPVKVLLAEEEQQALQITPLAAVAVRVKLAAMV
tara:strand:- start:182 stop:361 length:180 start_codon:yes stop_codon:yes gene_type:complete